MSGLSIRKKVHFECGQKGARHVVKGEWNQPAGKVPRITQLMALAIWFERLIEYGVVKDQAELARLGNVSRARVSQIMDLLGLCPEVQEAILNLPLVVEGKGMVTESQVQAIVRTPNWKMQLELWGTIEEAVPRIRSEQVQ